MNYYVLIGFHTAILTLGFFALYVMLQRDLELQQRQTCYVLFGCVIAGIGMSLEIMGNGDVETILLGKGIQLIGVSVFMVSLVSLTGYVCNVQVPFWYLSFTFLADVPIAYVHFARSLRHLFYNKISIVDHMGYGYMTVELGAVGVIFWVFSVIFPYISCLAMLGYSYFQGENRLRKKEFIYLIVLYVVLLLAIFLHGRGVLMVWNNPTMDFATLIFIGLVFSKWRNQGIDVVAAAAKTAIDAIDGGIITLNQYKDILYYNQAAEKIIPEISQRVGMNVDLLDFEFPDLMPGERAEVHINDHKYYMTMSPIYDSTDVLHGYAVLFNDMTEMFEMMEQIQEAQRKADEANRVKSMFIANISHELRTPMNAIMGMSDLIIEESRGRKVYDMAVTIKKASNNLLELVNNVLDISKLESGKMELVESDYYLEELVKETMGIMQIPASQHGLQVKYNVDGTLPCKLYGDDGKIRQCLINIINNGIKFTDEGFVRLDVSGIRRGDKVALSFMIQDTGVGIKEEDLGRVFGQFEQVDKIVNKGKEGSGLGLSITKQLVEMMGGVIDVTSDYGFGTTFTISLSQKIVDSTPVSESQIVEEEEADEVKMFEAPDINILVVDDNVVNLMVAKGILGPYKVQLDTGTSGEQALELVRDKDYDIVMMDHMMPGMDGIETVGLLRDYFDTKSIKPYIIALTANAFVGAEKMFLSHGFDGFLSKPIDKRAMYNILLKAIPEDRRMFVDQVLQPAAYTEDDLAELFMEGVDVRTAVENSGSGVSQYLNLLEMYMLEGTQKSNQIREAYEAKDWKNYSILTHGLKSTSLNIGAKQLSEDAKEHEFASKDEDAINVTFIDAHVDDLLNQYNQLLDDIKGVLDKQNAKRGKSDVVSKLPKLDKGKLRDELNHALALSEDFLSKEAAECIDKLLRYELEPEIEKTLSEIRVKYKMYDDDGAEAMLQELIDSL